jgi:hypothetical protein
MSQRNTGIRSSGWVSVNIVVSFKSRKFLYRQTH